MPLKTVLETLDGVDDAVKSFYTESDGKFVLQVDDVDTHPDVANLKSAYERVKADRDALKTEAFEARNRLKAIPSDFDPEKWEAAKSGKADPQELVQLRQTLEAERDEWKGKYDGLIAETRQRTVRDAVQSALAENGIPEGARRGAALDMMDGKKVEIQDGKAVIETDMGPMALTDYAKRWVGKEGQAYVAPASGGGAKGNERGAGSQKKPEDMSAQERHALQKENPEEFYRLFPHAKLR